MVNKEKDRKLKVAIENNGKKIDGPIDYVEVVDDLFDFVGKELLEHSSAPNQSNFKVSRVLVFRNMASVRCLALDVISCCSASPSDICNFSIAFSYVVAFYS